MLKSIEERMEDQLLEKERFRFNNDGGITASKTVEQLLKEPLDAASEESLNLWVSSVKNKILIDSILETLAEAVRNIPNDQELGAYIREAYNRTDGKFI